MLYVYGKHKRHKRQVQCGRIKESGKSKSKKKGRDTSAVDIQDAKRSDSWTSRCVDVKRCWIKIKL